MNGFKKTETKNKAYLYGIFAVVFAASFSVLFSVGFFLDDFTYKQVSVCETDEILQFLKWHIENYNGRTLVHCLEMLFLRYDWGFLLWKVLSAILICAFVFVSSKIVTRDKNNFNIAASASILFLFGVSPYIWNESIYWLSGSFNYFIPMMLFLVLMLAVDRKPDSVWLCVLSFICGATTEQVGMMTVGLFVILIADKLVSRQKVPTALIFNLIASVIGYCTVIFAGGTRTRVDTQSEITLTVFFENFVTIFQENWFGNFNLLVMLVPITFMISYWIYKYRKVNRAMMFAHKALIVLLWVLTGFNLLIKAVSVTNELFGLGITFPKALNICIFAVWLLYAVLFFCSFLLVTVLIYIKEKNVFPITFLILGFGSQFMMSVAGRSYFRTCLSMLFMFILFDVFSVISIWNDIKNTELFKTKIKPKAKIIKAASFIGIVAVCTVYAFSAQSIIYKNTSDTDRYTALSSAEMHSFTQGLEEDCVAYYANPDSDWNRRKDIMDFSKY